MEAILVVGGPGTRLRPLTDHMPKHLLPVGGFPLIVHQIVRAREAGVKHLVLATAYLAETFVDVLGDGSELGVKIDYAEEDEPLGTGGAIRNAAEALDAHGDARVLVFNGDIIDNHDIAEQLAVHRSGDADVTLYLTRVEDARAYGCVPTNESGRVMAFLEKMPEPVSDQINAGCYVFRRSVMDEIPAGRQVSIEHETFPGLLDSGQTVLGVVDDAYWRDLGTPASYVQGCADVVLGHVDAPARPGPPGESLVLGDAAISASAVLSGGTSVQPGCVVGDGAMIDRSVLMDGAVVGAHAVVRASALGRGVRIGGGAVLDDVAIGDGVEVPARARLEPGARLSMPPK